MDDGQILQQVKAILVRNNVDTQFLTVDVNNRAVFIKGVLTVHIYKASPKASSAAEMGKIKDEVKRTLRNVEQQILGMSEIKSLFMEFDNWMKTTAGWVERKV